MAVYIYIYVYVLVSICFVHITSEICQVLKCCCLKLIISTHKSLVYGVFAE